MKKFFLFITSIVMLVGCSSDDFEPTTAQDVANAKFQTEFTKKFGEIDKNQDWGFNESITVFDYTNASVTRGHNVNRNQWAELYNLPATVTHAEEEAVVDKLNQLTGWDAVKNENDARTFVGRNIDAKPTFDWKNYFCFHVHKGTHTQFDNSGGNIGVVSNKMNHLQAVYSNGTMEHINDFNHGANPAHGNSYEAATLMVNSTTYDFAYHNSIDSKYHNTFTVIDGAEIGYPGFYYICFDFFGNGDVEQPSNKNMGCARNYNYTDWIVRICPATFNMDGAYRIIAEDLGANESDFDYNDVVFDVKVVNESVEVSENNFQNKLVGYFELQAAGGTLPLTVAGYEVHELFGVAVNQMVNTGAGPSKESVQFRVILGDADWSTPGATLVKRIPVLVKNGNSVIELETETGNAPEKICVPTTFRWCKEYKEHAIYLGYPDFPKWVQNKNYEWKTNYVVEHLY